MRLIITEKNNSAQKIAEILSGGAAKETKSFTIPVFKWSDSEGETSVVGTGGHGVERAFPEEKEYKQWKLDLIHGLVDAPLITRPTDGKKNVNVPKDKKPEDMTLEECTALLGGAKAGKGAKTKKTAAPKTAAKKAPKKKAAKRAKAKKA